MSRLTRRRSALAAVLSAICLGQGWGAPSSGSRPVKLEDLLRIRNIEDARISPSGDRVAYVLSEIDLAKNATPCDIWLVEAAGGTALRLTSGPGRDEAPRWSPDGATLAFLSDRGGSKQLWLIDPGGGEARPAAAIKAAISSFAWSPDGRKIACLAASPPPSPAETEPGDDVVIYDKDVPGLELVVLDPATGTTDRLTRGMPAVVDFSWAPGAKEIVFAAQPSPRIRDMYQTDIYAVDLETRAVRDLVKRRGIDTFPRFSPDGRRVAFLSTEGQTDWIANWYLCCVPAEGGTPRNLTPELDEFLFNPQWSPDGRRIFFQSPQGLRNQLYSVALEGGPPVPLLADDDVWSDFSFSASGRRMAFLGTNSRTPTEVFVSGLDKFDPIRLTSTNPQLRDVALGKQEIVHWRSPDGLEIEGLLLTPPGQSSGRPYPLLTYVHGGPSGRFTASFSPQIGSPYPVQAECYPLQVLAGLGYAIFLPNPRGSYGYGGTFRKANILDWGGGDYRDIMSGIDALISRKIADADKLGVMGRSYGGYMTAWIITQTSRFKAASLGAGMSNLVSFYGQTDIPGFLEQYLGDAPWKALDRYLKMSPVTHAASIRTPTLILHGENDFRVPLPQAQELYAALKKNGVPAELIIYPRQGHVVAEPKFMKDQMERNLAWFGRWLNPAPDGRPAP